MSHQEWLQLFSGGRPVSSSLSEEPQSEMFQLSGPSSLSTFLDLLSFTSVNMRAMDGQDGVQPLQDQDFRIFLTLLLHAKDSCCRRHIPALSSHGVLGPEKDSGYGVKCMTL